MNIGWPDIEVRAKKVADSLKDARNLPRNLYGIPRGGVFAAQAVIRYCPHLQLVADPWYADVFIDDVLDSGTTKMRYARKYPDIPFFVLVDKQVEGIKEWVSFVWERMKDEFSPEDGPQDNIRRILQYIGEDPNREGLRDTPNRVVKSYAELFAGYSQDPASVFKVFDGEEYDEIIVSRNIHFASMCEHHIMPFLGVAHVAYLPDKKIIGLSKLARLVDIFSRRLQVQERLTIQITKAIESNLKPKGSACFIKAQHLCQSCRGVQKQNSDMVTSSLTGVFRNDRNARSELINLLEI